MNKRTGSLTLILAGAVLLALLTGTLTPYNVRSAAPPVLPAPLETTLPGLSPTVVLPTPVPPTSSPGLPTPAPTSVPSPTPCTLSFPDVPSGNIFYADIRFLACRGVVNGFGDGSFQPNSNTRRGEFAKIIVRGFGIATYRPLTPTFLDVPTTNIFYPFIEAAARAGLVIGGNGRFRPSDNITRAEVVVIIQRQQRYPVFTPTTPTFTDVPPDYFAYSTIETLVSVGIITGFTPTTFGPGAFIRRGELSRIVGRAIQLPPR